MIPWRARTCLRWIQFSRYFTCFFPTLTILSIFHAINWRKSTSVQWWGVTEASHIMSVHIMTKRQQRRQCFSVFVLFLVAWVTKFTVEWNEKHSQKPKRASSTENFDFSVVYCQWVSSQHRVASQYPVDVSSLLTYKLSSSLHIWVVFLHILYFIFYHHWQCIFHWSLLCSIISRSKTCARTTFTTTQILCLQFTVFHHCSRF